MSTLICIDNGGTLTDAIAVRNGAFYRAKSLTTPHDLSRCFLDAIAALSAEIYGSEMIDRLLGETEIIRYSTTQGTNALVQARSMGPRLGLILAAGVSAASLATTPAQHALFATLVGNRLVELTEPAAADDDIAYGQQLIQTVNTLLNRGANRLVLALNGDDYGARERRFRRLFLQKYPRHFLGAVPLLLTHELTHDADLVRRTWSALLNSFLHPTMEHFLYNAEDELRRRRVRRPLMVFRNDGNSSRVARTVALKTYSSGPRGGMEGAREYAAAYGVKRVITFDVGGTTTDIGVAHPQAIEEHAYGKVEGVETAFPLCDILSVGIGGSSVLGYANGEWKIGPESVGAAPGPACFGRGGEQLTMTDVYLLMGLFDPASYFGGRLSIDRSLSEQALVRQVLDAAGISFEAALLALDAAYHQAMARAILGHAQVDGDTLLMAFGGAGPMSACRVAEIAAVSQVLVPHAASVFCAYGIGFSDVHYRYSEPAGADANAVRERLLERARRDMFAEGFDAVACDISAALVWRDDRGRAQRRTLVAGGQDSVPAGAEVKVEIVRRLTRFPLAQVATSQTTTPQPQGSRRCLQDDGRWLDTPLYALEQLQPGAVASGPALLEDAYVTVRILPGWVFKLTGNRDVLLTRKPGDQA